MGATREQRCRKCHFRSLAPELLHNKEWLIREYGERSVWQIARELGCSESTVRSHLKRHGVKLRDKFEAAALRYEGTKGRGEMGRNRQMVTAGKHISTVKHLPAEPGRYIR
jgi:predicted transcriptional regulator